MKGTEHDVAFFLALGYAPDFTRTVCKNQHGMLAFFGYCVSERRPQKCLKNKTECLLFLLFFRRFGRHFPSRGYPWSFPGPFEYQGGVPGRFLMDFTCPRGGFGSPFGRFWCPLGGLGSHLGAKTRAKSVKKSVPGAQCVPEASFGAKREGPGPS